MPNTYSQIYFHYVFSPKYRQSLIRPEIEEEIQKYISGIIKNQGQLLININGMPDHIHLLARLKPSMAPSKLIQTVKTNSSKWINNKKFFNFKFAWQVGGGVFSVSHRNIPGLINYLSNQKEHHKKVSFKEEYLTLLKHYGVSFEEKYLLDFF